MAATAQAETLRKPGLIAQVNSRIYTPRNAPLALMLAVLGAYLLTMSGHTYSPDEETMLEVSRSLVTKGTWAIPQSQSFVDVAGADGRRYSQYGPGQSFAAVPWVAAGLLVGNTFPKDQAGYPLRLVLGSFNVLVAAGICGLLAALGMALGYGRRASLLVGAALAFSSYLWPHSRTFFSEPLTALLMLGSFYLLVRARHTPPSARRGMVLRMAGSGALLALVLATKIQYAVVVPAFALYLVWATLSRQHDNSPRSRSQSLTRISSWGAGFALGLVPLGLYNWAVFGSPLLTGYGTDLRATFKTPLGEGVYGLLLSPGKGLAWYAPPVLLAAWGLWRFVRKHRAEAAFVLLLGASVVTLFALYAFWHGDGSWGPRYLVPFLPFALLPAVALFEVLGAAPLKRAAVAVVLSLGFFVNLLGALVNFDTYINLGYDDETRHFVPAASPIVGHFNLLGQRLRLDEIGFNRPTGRVVFRGGFSYSEGDKTKGEMLPRWTTGRATMQVWPDLSRGPASVTLRLADHRPPELPRASLAILVNGSPVTPQAQPVADMPPSIDYTFQVAANPSTIEVQSDTWNPAKVVVGSERDEEIGLRLNDVIVAEGGQVRPYALSEALPAPPYYPQPRWYYDPGTPHPADLWPVYMAETGMGRKAMLALGGPVVLLALACIFFGVRGLRSRVVLGAE